MLVVVRMIAFHDENTTRNVDIPDSEIPADQDIDSLLALTFQYGQNEFCQDAQIRKTRCSVSVGDVIELNSVPYLVMPLGFMNIEADYERYKKMDNNARFDFIYGRDDDS